MTIGKLTYKCVHCKKKMTIDMLPKMTDGQIEYVRELFDKKICPKCLIEKLTGE